VLETAGAGALDAGMDETALDPAAVAGVSCTGSRAESDAAGLSPQSASVVVAGMSRLVGAFGFGSELAALLNPLAVAVIWQSMPIVLWMA
jgi:hypothetical protein